MAAGRRSAIRSLPRHKGDAQRVIRALLTHARATELGRLNNTIEMDLTADGIATTTTATVPGVRSSTVALWEPQDANAMAQRATTRAVCTKNLVTVTHIASALARKIRIALFA